MDVKIEHKPKILIVENHESVRSALKEWLMSNFEYCEFFEAESAEEGINIALKIKPNVILMDIMLGQMNGIEATKHIKTNLPETSVIIITNHENIHYQEQAKLAGACDYILKRKINEDLLSSLKKQLPQVDKIETKNIELLLIEDNLGDARLIKEMIVEYQIAPINVAHFDRLSKGIDYLNSHRPDIILLDLSLPDSHGLNTLLTLIKHEKRIPIVVLTGLNDQSLALEAVREGAQDYIVKGKIYDDMLIRTINYALERHKINEQLKRMTHTLVEQEKRLRLMIEKNVDGIIIVNSKGIIRFVNPSAIDIMDKEAEELLNKYFEWFSYIKSDQEIILTQKDGNKIIAEIQHTEIEWEGETVLLISMRDVTYRKEAEKIIEEKQKLQGVVEMAGAVCHELNQPLQALFSEMDLFLMLIDANDPNRNRINKLQQHAERIGNITKRLNSVTQYKIKHYLRGVNIIDIDEASKPEVESKS
ncbi:MAG: response regulator [Desulfobacterales bacterium]|nr:response regulator [Desulfobacterales bacterium]